MKSIKLAIVCGFLLPAVAGCGIIFRIICNMGQTDIREYQMTMHSKRE